MKFKFIRYKHNFDELVFEGRNKSYGAYVLRKAYEKRINIALLIICLGTICLTLGSFIYLTYNAESSERQIDLSLYDGFDLRIKQNILPELPKGEKPKEKEKPMKKTKEKPDKPKSKNEVIKKSDKPDFTKLTNEIQDTIKLDTLAKNGLSKLDSTTAANVAEGKRLDSLNGLGGTTPNTSMMQVNRLGGIDEFVAWIRQNFVYPTSNRYQIDVTINVYFCVTTEGLLSDIKIIKEVPNKYYNEEILRLVKSSPIFKVEGNDPNCRNTMVAIKIPSSRVLTKP